MEAEPPLHEPGPPLQHDISKSRKTLTYRVRGIPSDVDVIALRESLKVLLEAEDLHVESLARSSIRREGQVATIRVAKSAKLSDARDEWRIPAGRTLAVDANNKGVRMLAIDTHFLGFTPLYSPTSDTEHDLDCIAISGLGSHAFGSWKDRDSHYMWLRDALPHDLPGARVLTYGYDTRLAGSHSFQNLEDVALKFRRSLRIALGNRPPDRPLIFIAHSLGGLVLKQALIKMASGAAEDICIFQSTYGILFFGVPNQGMDISSLLAMVDGQHNLPFLTMLSKDAGILQEVIDRFRTVFKFKDSEIISLYETHASRTARKDATGKWSMSGDYAVLVDRFSARSGRPWEERDSFLQPIGRNHSDMVKYSEYDDDVGIVSDFLNRFAKAAPAVIKNRIKSLDSSMPSFPSKARLLALESPSLVKEAGRVHEERPVEAEHMTKRLKTSNRKQSEEREGSNDRCQESGSKVVVEVKKGPQASSPEIHKNKVDLEIFANAGFEFGAEHWPEPGFGGLTWAARKGHIFWTQYLLDGRTSIETKDKDGWTPLHWAAFTANKKLFRLLLSRGAEFGAITYSGDTTFHLASLWSEGHAKRYAEDYVGSYSDREALGLELLDKGFDVDIENAEGETPLQCAAACGLESMVLLLTSRGARLNRKDRLERRPLLRAADNGHMGVVKIIMERQSTTQNGECLVKAAYKGMRLAVRTLLDAGVMIDADDYTGCTALISAAAQGHETVVRLLLDEGANVNARNKCGETAVIKAVAYRPKEDNMSQLRTIQLLIKGGADVRAVSNDGSSALHLAAQLNNLVAVDLLLIVGADPFALNSNNKTPLDLAWYHDDVVKRLETYIPEYRYGEQAALKKDHRTPVEPDHQPIPRIRDDRQMSRTHNLSAP